MHQGKWEKSAVGAHEIRGKTLGLIGYGHIGQQVGLLAESFGLQVKFFDATKKLALGNAQSCSDMNEILKTSDFLSLHIPASPKGAVIGEKELALMKPGSMLLNLSRGKLVDLKALKAAIESKHIAGAGLDVFPSEPESNSEPYTCELTGVANVVLTPHIGGSTEEAQYQIALEVSDTCAKYLQAGTTAGAVNFPQVDLPMSSESHRVLHIHKNIPGVVSEITAAIASVGANIEAQHLSTYKDIGYLIVDVNKELSSAVKEKIAAHPSTIKVRVL
jgi:D-3-phosphoglycerate dehydrogenase